jgi:NDP-sugar pyrophosphorylase family protein
MPRALVLAAGRSTRISRVANGLPKPLLEIGGTSLLGWNLSWLATHGVRDIWINLHHEADRIRTAIGDGAAFGVRIQYAHEPELLGTAGAWRALADEWKDTALVIYGDNFMRFDLGALLDAHWRGGCSATIALFDPAVHAHTGGGGGRARLSEGKVLAFDESGGAGGDAPINAGAYVLEPAVLASIAPGFQDFGHDVLPRLAAAGALGGHLLEPGGFCLGLDTPDRYERAKRLFAGGEVAP